MSSSCGRAERLSCSLVQALTPSENGADFNDAMYRPNPIGLWLYYITLSPLLFLFLGSDSVWNVVFTVLFAKDLPRPNVATRPYFPLMPEDLTLPMCPIPVLLQRHDTSAITTGYNRSPMLSPRLDLPGFWPGTETKRDLIWYSAGE